MLFNIIALALLVFGFAVLVVTFLWVARLLSMRSHARATREMNRALAAQAEALDEGAPAADEGDGTGAVEVEPAEVEAEERRAAGRAVILGANLSLVLGILSAVLFWISPLVAVLSLAAVYYGGRCLWLAWTRFRIFVFRALIGLVLGSASLALVYLKLSGQLAFLVPMLGMG